eukprot:scaffold149850_cov40-Cyclotella_meneghiniana.AAC.1
MATTRRILHPLPTQRHVCAPTGSGKTVVGEIALRIALTDNTKGVYHAAEGHSVIKKSTRCKRRPARLATGDGEGRRLPS